MVSFPVSAKCEKYATTTWMLSVVVRWLWPPSPVGIQCHSSTPDHYTRMRSSRRRRSRKLIRFSASLLPQTATFTTHSEIRQPRSGVLPIASLASWGRQTAKREAHTGGRTQDLPMTLLRVGCSTNGALRAVITLMFLFLVQRIQSVKPSKDCYASLGFLNIVCRAIRQIAGNKRSDS